MEDCQTRIYTPSLEPEVAGHRRRDRAKPPPDVEPPRINIQHHPAAFASVTSGRATSCYSIIYFPLISFFHPTRRSTLLDQLSFQRRFI